MCVRANYWSGFFCLARSSSSLADVRIWSSCPLHGRGRRRMPLCAFSLPPPVSRGQLESERRANAHCKLLVLFVPTTYTYLHGLISARATFNASPQSKSETTNEGTCAQTVKAIPFTTHYARAARLLLSSPQPAPHYSQFRARVSAGCIICLLKMRHSGHSWKTIFILKIEFDATCLPCLPACLASDHCPRSAGSGFAPFPACLPTMHHPNVIAAAAASRAPKRHGANFVTLAAREERRGEERGGQHSITRDGRTDLCSIYMWATRMDSMILGSHLDRDDLRD